MPIAEICKWAISLLIALCDLRALPRSIWDKFVLPMLGLRPCVDKLIELVHGWAQLNPTGSKRGGRYRRAARAARNGHRGVWRLCDGRFHA